MICNGYLSVFRIILDYFMVRECFVLDLLEYQVHLFHFPVL